jgi:adenylyltransferase/sulfurtransferase
VALPPLVEPGADLTTEEVGRYSRHLLLPEIGREGQRRLKNARVLVVGAGGLGSPVLLYLAAAGVGTIGVVDDDLVDASNLQRQVVHGTSDVGRPKVDSAAEAVARVNPLVTVVPHRERLTAANALDLVGGYDLVLDGTDNFPTRYLVADACVLAARPLVWGSILRFDGQVSVFWAEHGRPTATCSRPLLPRARCPRAARPACWARSARWSAR